MGNLSNFNPREHEMPSRDQLVGKFNADIIDAEIVDGDYGKRLKVQMTITSPGPGNNRTQYDWIKLTDFPSEKSEEFNKARLSQLLFAAGIPDADDTSELIGKRLLMKLRPQRKWNKETKAYDISDEYSEVQEYIVPAAADQSAPAAEQESITSIPDDLF